MIVQIILAAATLLTAITGFVALFRKQNDTHRLVNAAHTDNLDRIDQLTATITKAGLPVPPRNPSIGKE
jgi:HAMP domain-containing protein